MIDRRQLLHALGACALLDSKSAGAQEGARGIRIWDVHSHLHTAAGGTLEQRMGTLVRCMDRLGIERVILSQGYSANLHPTIDQLREENDRVMRAVRLFPD